MMKTKILFIALLALSALFFAGCTASNPNISKVAVQEEKPQPYVGTWLRQEIIVGGSKMVSPSTLVITPTGTFFSINDYGFAEGTMAVEGDQMTTVVKSGLTPGQTVSHKFTISDDGQTMTFIITSPQGEMREIYKRKE